MTQKRNNPFEYMQMAFNMMDTGLIKEQIQKNMEAAVAAGQIMSDCFKQNVQQAMDLMQNNLQHAQAYNQESMNMNGMGDLQNKCYNMMSGITENIYNSGKNMSETYNNATRSVFEIYGKRFSDCCYGVCNKASEGK